VSLEPTDISVPHRKPEDTASGCRLLASDDRERAEQSGSAHMRLRLINSAGAWTARAAQLDRVERFRNRTIETAPREASGFGENDNG
jgi:hypothetical protein